MSRQELLDALTAERYDQTWWKTPPKPSSDDELTCARRRRELASADEPDSEVS